MKSLLHSVLIERIVFDNESTEILLHCTIYENGVSFKNDYVLCSQAFNQLMSECTVRDLEIDFESNSYEHISKEGKQTTIVEARTQEQNYVFLPQYCFPKSKYQMVA